MGRIIREFFAGFAVLARGFGLWRRRPWLMLLGLLPVVIVAAILIAVAGATELALHAVQSHAAANPEPA